MFIFLRTSTFITRHHGLWYDSTHPLGKISRLDSLYLCGNLWLGTWTVYGGKWIKFLRRWIQPRYLFFKCFHFLQEVYPPNIILTEEDKTNICYLAFPDSNSSCLGDTQFHIRVKQCSTSSSLSPCHTTYNNTCPVFLRINPHFFFGFVYFRQIKDASLPRGYFQKVSSTIYQDFEPWWERYENYCSWNFRIFSYISLRINVAMKRKN